VLDQPVTPSHDAPAPVVDTPAPRRTTSPRALLLTGGPMLVAGLVLVGFGLTTAQLVTLAKALLVLGGLGVALSGLSRVAHGLRGRPTDVVFGLAMTWLVVLVLAAVLAPVLPLGNHADAAGALGEPIYQPPSLLSEHPLGTNNYGLDMLARTVYGARTSLVVATVAVLLGACIGGLVGLTAGFFRGALDSVVGVLANALLAVPPLILLVALGTVLDPGVRNIALALSLLTIPSFVRLTRANTIAFAQREFVLAARALGATRARLMLRELLPNVVLPVLSLAVVLVSMLIVAEASLSFLGLGIQPPAPTWGNMIAEGQAGVMEQRPFIVVVPGVCLFLTVFAFNLLGERAQKRWDPRSAKL
jgi:peptide/nickel transport system permease protein